MAKISKEALRNQILEAAKKQKESLEKKNANFISLKEGKTTLRLVPWKDSPDGLPFQTVQVHYSTGTPFLSPRTNGDTDPIADFGDMLTAAGNLSKEDWKAIKNKFSPQTRVHAPVIVRGKEEEGVKLWGFSPKIQGELLDFFMNEDIGDITDVDEGYDIIVEYIPKEKNGGFAKTTIDVARRSSPLSKDKAQVAKWLEEQPDLLAQIPTKTHEELVKLREVMVAGPAAVASTTTAPATPASSEPAAKSEVVVSKDVEEDFANIFED